MPASYKTAQRPRGYRILPIVDHRSRCRFAQFKLRAHLLDLQRLLVELCGESFHSFLSTAR